MSKRNGWELVAVPSWDTAEDDGGKDAPVFQLAKELPPDHPQRNNPNKKRKRKRNRKHESQQPEQTTKAKGEDARASPAKEAVAGAKEEATQKKREPKRRKTVEKKQKSGNPNQQQNQVAAASPPKRKGPPLPQQQQQQQQKPPTQQQKQKQQQPQKRQQNPKQQPKKQTALSSRPGATTAAAGGAPPPMTALQQKLYQKLRGSRFRWLNEQLYSVSGDEAKRLFDENPDYFQEYHSGFSEQVSSWPVNPVDQIIRSLEEEGEDEEKGAKGKRQKRKKKQKKLCIADFGCGEAKIGATLGKKHTVYSFDLVAVNEHVTACDIANVPLENESVDVAIFCLSLMGSNFMDFLEEAHRVLKPGGRLKIAEVKSRFGSPARVKQFQQALHSLGFDLLEEDDSNKMFVRMELNKSDRESVKVDFQLNVCRYKKR
ncbi:25S rRNA (adenine645-N1)-methyltransferase [Balamuthia mandrillaris]